MLHVHVCNTCHKGFTCYQCSIMYTVPKVIFQVEKFVQFQEAKSGIQCKEDSE